MVMMVLKDDKLTKIAGNVRPDSKRRVVLPNILVNADTTYHIYYNRLGQIVLDPQVTIPASELWVFKNREFLASLDKGMAESSMGKVVKRGSFAKFVKDAA